MQWNKWIKRGGILVAVLFAAVAATPSFAEEPIPTALDTADAQDFLGIWNVKIEVMGREFELILTLSDLDGKMGATLDSAQQAEPLAIPEIVKTDDGLELSGELKFGDSFSLDIIIDIVRDGDGLGGRIKDKGGIFNADLVGTAMTQEDLDSVQGRRPDPTEARLTLDEGKRIRIGFADLEMGSSDWELFEKLGEGDVFTFTLSRATKMYTDVDLAFGDTVVKSENVAEDYPGVYSLWLKKTADGWSLVFNEKPDIWGTRYDPENDAAEVPLTLAAVDGDPQEKFVIELERGDGDAGLLKLRWANHEWSAPFTIQAGKSEATAS